MIVNVQKRGAVYAEQAYAQGKMLDHSEWDGVLPRQITPSDVDMVLDNWGRIVFVEFSRECGSWLELSIGQRKFYQAAVGKAGRHIAALCQHSTPVDQQVKTRTGVVSVEFMFWHNGSFRFAKGTNGHWIDMVDRWYVSELGPNQAIAYLCQNTGTLP